MMVPLNGKQEGCTREDLLDEIERDTGIRPDIKQTMLELLDRVRALVEGSSPEVGELAVDGIDIILCNVETRLMRRAVAGLVIRERPPMGVSAHEMDYDTSFVHPGTETKQ